MTRDEIHTERVAAGSLAAALMSAERALLDSERQLEQMLDSLYSRDGWSDWEAGCWTLDVYDVVPSEAAAVALIRAGWLAVRQHDHSRERFRNCACLTRREF